MSKQKVNGKELPPVRLANPVQEVRHVVNTKVIRHAVNKVWSGHQNHFGRKPSRVPVPQLGTIISVRVVPQFEKSGVLVGYKDLEAKEQTIMRKFFHTAIRRLL